MGDEVNPPPAPRRRKRCEVPRPRHVFVTDDGSTLRVGFRWVWGRFRGPAAMCLVWNSFVVLWYWNALRSDGRMKWMAIIITLPHAAIGVFLLYATLAGLLNRTVVTVTSEFVTARCG